MVTTFRLTASFTQPVCHSRPWSNSHFSAKMSTVKGLLKKVQYIKWMPCASSNSSKPRKYSCHASCHQCYKGPPPVSYLLLCPSVAHVYSITTFTIYLPNTFQDEGFQNTAMWPQSLSTKSDKTSSHHPASQILKFSQSWSPGKSFQKQSFSCILKNPHTTIDYQISHFPKIKTKSLRFQTRDPNIFLTDPRKKFLSGLNLRNCEVQELYTLWGHWLVCVYGTSWCGLDLIFDVGVVTLTFEILSRLYPKTHKMQDFDSW